MASDGASARDRARRRYNRTGSYDGAAPLTITDLVSGCDEVRFLLGEHMDAASFRVASRLVCKAPLVELDQAAFDRLLWGTASPADAFREARFLGHPHLRPQNPILAAGLADWLTGTEPSEAYCACALAQGSLELLAWARANGCPWSAEVRDSVTELRVPDGTSSILHHSAFEGCGRLQSITIPEGIAALGHSALAGCAALHTVVLPSSLTKLGKYTFFGCLALTALTLPAGLIALGDFTFYDCRALTGITVPAGVAALGSDTVAGCHALRSVTLESARTLPGRATTFLGCGALTRIHVRPGLRQAEFDRLLWSTRSPAEAELLAGLLGRPHLHLHRRNPILADPFPGWGTEGYCKRALEERRLELLAWAIARGCPCSDPVRLDITTLPLPDGITDLDDGAFQHLSRLRSVRLSADITSLDHGVFAGCSGLKLVTLPPRLTRLGEDVFDFCTSLANLELPRAVTSLGRFALANCRALTQIQLPPGLQVIGQGAFVNCRALRSIKLPFRLTVLGEKAFQNCTALRSIVLSPRLTEISSDTFFGCCELHEVQVPASVRYIYDSAFEGCVGLTRVKLPPELTFLGDRAFAGCVGLTHVDLPPKLTFLGDRAFEGCRALFGDILLRLPDRLGVLREFTFKDCTSLQEVVLPVRLRAIDPTVFDGCSSLRVVMVPRDLPVDLLAQIEASLPPGAAWEYRSRSWR